MRFFFHIVQILRFASLYTFPIPLGLKTKEEPKKNQGEGVRRNALRGLRPKSTSL